MADVLTKTQRSYNMSMIRSSHTGPEISLRDILIKNGFYDFDTYSERITGKPDFYFPEQKVALFLDGCFWHGCKRCYKTPASNQDFWNTKIKNNLKRDRIVNNTLRKDGIIVVRVKEHEFKKDPKNILKKLQSVLKSTKQPKVLDLFAGAGGFSEGFINAGCEIIAHIEMDKDACETIRTRMIYHALRSSGRLGEYKKYLLGKKTLSMLVDEYDLHKEYESVIEAKIDRNTCTDLIKEVKMKLKGESLDIIIGGPPCQAYSNIGRSSDRKHMRRDKRKFLYIYYVEFLKAFKPKIFVFENVPGLLSAGNGLYLRKMRRLMKEAGYETDFNVLNAAKYGVPQERKRVIMVGWRKDSGLTAYPKFQEVERNYGVADFLNDLPRLSAGTGEVQRKFKSSSALLRKLEIVNPKINILCEHVARPQTKQDLEIYRLAVKRKNKGKNIRYNELPERLKTHKNQTGFLDRFKVVDVLGTASHTVIAHISKDGHYYIHPDIKQNRSLTPREAARLQTFPDDFKFERSRTSQFRQIGNAVPPMLSKIIARKLVKLIRS